MYTLYFGRDQAEQLTCSTIKSKVITVKALFYALRLVELGVVVVVVGGGGGGLVKNARLLKPHSTLYK